MPWRKILINKDCPTRRFIVTLHPETKTTDGQIEYHISSIIPLGRTFIRAPHRGNGGRQRTGKRHRRGGHRIFSQRNRQVTAGSHRRFPFRPDGIRRPTYCFAEGTFGFRTELLHAGLRQQPDLGGLHPRHRFAHQYSAVGLYVDNVGYADKSAYDIELLDVERVDVLRGPQATLYGRNAMGGLLRVFTRNPFHYQGTDIRLGTSVKDKGYQLSASHYQKTSHRMAYALSGFYKHSEGFFENVTRHETVGGNETGGGRVRVIYLPGRGLETGLLYRLFVS